MAISREDKRLKLIEMLVTLSGFLAIIFSIQQYQSKPILDDLTELFVLLIVSSFLAYASLVIGLTGRKVQIALAGFSASYSAILTIALSSPLLAALVGLQGIVSSIVLAVVFLGGALLFFYVMYDITNNLMSQAAI